MSVAASIPRPSVRAPGFARFQTLLPDVGAVALLFFLTCLFFWRLLTPIPANRMSFQDGDFVEQFYAFTLFRAQELAAGRLPTWNPFVYGGGPFIADVQSAVFYPPSWLTTLIGVPRGYPLIALELEAIGHFFLAAVFAYLLGRALVAHRGAALVVGIVYAFGGYLTSYPSQQLSLLEVHTWLPLVMLGVHLSTERDLGVSDRLLRALLTGLALGISTLGGHPQSSAYVVYGSLAYWAFRAWCLWREQLALQSPSRRVRDAVSVALTAGYLPLGVLLAAVQLVPTLEFIRLSTRAELGYDFTWWGFPLQDVVQLLIPGVVSVYSPMYVGILPLGLATAAALWYRDRLVVFWAALAAAALAVSFGGHTFIYSILYNVAPGFASFRDQERSIVLFSLAMGVLSGFGMLFLLRAAPAHRIRTLWRVEPAALAAGGAMLAGYGFLIVFALSHIAGGKLDDLSSRAAWLLVNLIAITAVLVIRRLMTGRSSAWVVGALACSLVVLDLFSVNWKNNLVPIPPGERYAPTPITETLRERIGPWRAHNEFQMPLNYGDVYRIEDTGGASPLQVAVYEELRKRLPRERFFELMGVKYLITWEGGPPGGTRLAEHRPDRKDPNKVFYLYELQDPPARFRLVGSATVADGAQALEVLASKQFDPARQVVLAESPPFEVLGEPQGSVEVVERLPSRLALSVNTDRPAILVMAEVYYPGWKAFVDGNSVPIWRADQALRAIPVPAGSSRIEMVYDPASLKLGAAITLVTLAASIGGGAVCAGVRRRQGRLGDIDALA